ncbi:hypothetical protein BDN71DRAFT_1545874 [Pleurotus eryngii]|uniref:Uncharacterized protein n=1 Tax=Pleurotus eryngii TaxID=5323 RepID=A0A9P5ZZN4_PLEER|nr:hypothetical protein BDN71DRAFT_1545874 [Pleurotus eryngii]
MAVFNPRILDASLRDVANCLSDHQKADVLLYALENINPEGQSRTIIENAVQSCLQISNLTCTNVAKARVLRAKARLAGGTHFGAQEDLEAALMAEPENEEAKSLLQIRATLEKQSPVNPSTDTGVKFSAEIWRQIVLFLPRRDLKTLLWVPHTLSKIASQLLFRKINLYFSGWSDEDEDDSWHSHNLNKEQESWHSQRSADILTRIILDPSFAGLVKTLRIYATKRDRDGTLAFQIGMLANALPKLINLKNVHIAASSDGLLPMLRILQTTSPKLRGLSISSPDGLGEIACLEFKHLAQFSYRTTKGNSDITQICQFVFQNRNTLRIISLDASTWPFPSEFLSLRNLTHVNFVGQFPLHSHTIYDLLNDGRQLESLSIGCYLECGLSSQFRELPTALPFLRYFAFAVNRMNRRFSDPDMFPAIADFLRERKQLKTLHLSVPDEHVQRAVGFDASIWGVLPSLVTLKSLSITYPLDLSPGLASWLVPRSVLALNLDYEALPMRDPVQFLNQLRIGVPPSLRYIGLSDLTIRSPISAIVEQGFPMVRLIRVGSNYWTVVRNVDDTVVELEQWPRRRVLYHVSEWLEWLGCEDARWRDHSEFLA